MSQEERTQRWANMRYDMHGIHFPLSYHPRWALLFHFPGTAIHQSGSCQWVFQNPTTKHDLSLKQQVAKGVSDWLATYLICSPDIGCQRLVDTFEAVSDTDELLTKVAPLCIKLIKDILTLCGISAQASDYAIIRIFISLT